MDATVLSGLRYNNEEEALKSLFDAFGSVFSLKEIASAYCDAGKNADLASEILCDMQGSSSTSIVQGSIVEARTKESSGSSYSNKPEKSAPANEKLKASKQKWCSASAGSVSSVLGKYYAKPVPPTNGSYVASKPLRVDSTQLPMSEVWREGAGSNPPKDARLHKDMEDFLCKMLGDGFHLSRDVIREVLEKCGFDVEQSMEKLMRQSAEISERRIKALSKSSGMFADANRNSIEPSSQRRLQRMNPPGGIANRVLNSNGEELPSWQKERNDLGKEVLTSLFTVPERCEDSSRRTERAFRRPEVFGQVVSGPPQNISAKHKEILIPTHHDIQDDDDDGEGSFLALRRAVKEYRGAMQEYYKAAVAAFAKGDHARANKLSEQGQFFHQKAREADEESAQKIFETRNVETEDEVMPIDLHDRDAKEAIRLLKCHISSLAGIGSFKYLKVVVETDDEDTSKGARRRLILKLLQKESIEWIEGGNSGTILINLEKIDRNNLKFLKK